MNDQPQTTISREDILSMTELPWESVKLHNGKQIIVQGMTGTQRDAFEASMQKKNGKRDLANVRARLAVKCIVDRPGGNRIFNDRDVDKLGLIRVDVLQKVFEASQRVNGFSDEDLEELGKSSEPEDSDASSSSSPQN